jgi:hypothetical protein
VEAVRVDPNAAVDGSGRSWQDPRNDLRAALAAAAGGGEVWVLRGPIPADPAFDVPSGVRLRGGFIGTENAPEERVLTEYANYTELSAAADSQPALVTVRGQHDVLLDRLRFGYGNLGFLVEGSTQVTLDDLDVSYGYHTAHILDSSARVQRMRSVTGYEQILITDSNVVCADTQASATVVNSRLLVERCPNCGPFSIDETSEAFFVDTRFTTMFTSGGTSLQVDGRAAVVGSRFLANTGGKAPLSGTGSALVFNSSFLETTAWTLRGLWPSAAAIEAAGEVSASTFYQTLCFQDDAKCRMAAPNAEINNSLFVRAVPDFSEGQPFQTAEARLGVPPASNCATYRTDLFDLVDEQLQMVNDLCVDRGNADALELSRQHLMEYAAPFVAPPFDADLSRYSSSEWWRNETVLSQDNRWVTSTCQDLGAPDPGAHALRACSP